MAAPLVFTELRPPLAADEAIVEADRCLDCGGPYAPAPCSVACPAGIDVPTFIRQLAAGSELAAAETIYRENLLGGTCARVCPVEVLCEGACVLEHEGQPPIRIAALQRFATDAAEDAGLPLRAPAEPRDGRVAVVGAGPAGLACAGELAARGRDVVVFDEHPEVGGIVRTAIAPYRQVVEPLPAERRALERLGVRFRLGERVGSTADVIEASPDAVFLGVGLGEDRELDLPGAALPGYWRSLDFIATVKERRLERLDGSVVVLGGGNTAIDVAREAVRLGAPEVTIAYRRTRDVMPAYAFEVEEAEAEGIRFLWRCVPVELRGRGRVERIVLERAGERLSVPAATVVAAIGQLPRAELAAWTDELARAGIPVYQGGDAVNGGKSVVQAVADGKAAARAIEEALCAT
jgi:glutamate synthase (NADPH/NADH) small chain